MFGAACWRAVTISMAQVSASCKSDGWPRTLKVRQLGVVFREPICRRHDAGDLAHVLAGVQRDLARGALIGRAPPPLLQQVSKGFQALDSDLHRTIL